MWQTKIAALGCLGALTARAPDQMSACLPDIIPAVTAIMGDAKPQVKARACCVGTAATRVGHLLCKLPMAECNQGSCWRGQALMLQA